MKNKKQFDLAQCRACKSVFENDLFVLIERHDGRCPHCNGAIKFKNESKQAFTKDVADIKEILDEDSFDKKFMKKLVRVGAQINDDWKWFAQQVKVRGF